MFLNNIEFLNKEYFILMLIIPFLVYFYYKKNKSWINFIFYEDFKNIFWSINYLFYLKILLVIAILINFIFIFANPNKTNISKNVEKNWIDIVLALDISLSMEASDLFPNRIEAAKSVISNFIWKLKTDRLWLVVFAWKPFISIPLTFDYNILKESISNLSTNNINQNRNWLNWTAIWDAILMSKTLFKAPKNIKEDEYKKREKVIILLTDWDANVWVDPNIAALSVKDENIKIYTIWIWSEKWWTITYNFWWFQNTQKIPPLNDTALKQIASNTSWKYFRADNNETFEKIFNELSKLDKNNINIEVKKQYSEYYQLFLVTLTFFIWIFCFLTLYSLKIWMYGNNKF